MIIDAELDLHKLNIRTKEELVHYILNFIQNSYDSDYHNIRIITGRGVHSLNKPMLKPEAERVLKYHKLIDSYRIDASLGAFEINLIN